MRGLRWVFSISVLFVLNGTAWGGSVEVTNDASAVGNYGLAVTLEPDATKGTYVQKAVASDVLTAKFKWRKGTVVLPSTGTHGYFLMLLSRTGLELGVSGTGAFLWGGVTPGGFVFNPGCRDDADGAHFSSNLLIPLSVSDTNEFLQFEFTFRRSAPGAANGQCCLTIVGVGQTCVDGVDNSNTSISGISLGLMWSALPANHSGTFHIDEVIVSN